MKICLLCVLRPISYARDGNAPWEEKEREQVVCRAPITQGCMLEGSAPCVELDEGMERAASLADALGRALTGNAESSANPCFTWMSCSSQTSCKEQLWRCSQQERLANMIHPPFVIWTQTLELLLSRLSPT